MIISIPALMAGYGMMAGQQELLVLLPIVVQNSLILKSEQDTIVIMEILQL